MNQPPEQDQLRGVENRKFAAQVLASMMEDYRIAANHAVSRTHEMPRPTLATGFPPGYREALNEMRRGRAAERAMISVAAELGIDAEFIPLYNEVVSRVPVPQRRTPPEPRRERT